MTADGAEVGSAEVTGDGAEVMADLTPDNLIRGVQICQENVADSVKTCQETITKFTKKLSNALKASADELVDAKKKGRELEKKVSELEKKVSELEKKLPLQDATVEELQRENNALKLAVRGFCDGGWHRPEPSAAVEVPPAEPAAVEVAAAEPATEVSPAEVEHWYPEAVERIQYPEAVARMRRSDDVEEKANEDKRAAIVVSDAAYAAMLNEDKRAATVDSDAAYAAKLALGDRTDKRLTRRHSEQPARVVKKQKTSDGSQSDGSESDEVLSEEEDKEEKEEDFEKVGGWWDKDNSRFTSMTMWQAFHRSCRGRKSARKGTGIKMWPFDKDVPEFPKHGQAKSREEALSWLQATVRSDVSDTLYICYTINGKPKWFVGEVVEQQWFTSGGSHFTLTIRYENGDADELILPVSEVRFGNVRNADQHERCLAR